MLEKVEPCDRVVQGSGFVLVFYGLCQSSSSSSSTATAADAVVTVMATEITATMIQRRMISANMMSPVESIGYSLLFLLVLGVGVW